MDSFEDARQIARTLFVLLFPSNRVSASSNEYKSCDTGSSQQEEHNRCDAGASQQEEHKCCDTEASQQEEHNSSDAGASQQEEHKCCDTGASQQEEHEALMGDDQRDDVLKAMADDSPDNAWARIAQHLEERLGPLPGHIQDHAQKIISWVKENPRDAAVVAVGVTGFILMCFTPLIIGGLGFSAIGPVAGSTAAAWQSAYGATAVFSTLQSAAMGGYGVSILATISAATATTYLGSVAIFKLNKFKKFMTFMKNHQHILLMLQHLAIKKKP